MITMCSSSTYMLQCQLSSDKSGLCFQFTTKQHLIQNTDSGDRNITVYLSRLLLHTTFSLCLQDMQLLATVFDRRGVPLKKNICILW